MNHFHISRLRQEKKPILLDGLFYLPQSREEPSGPISLFPQDKKVAIEYCSGNGEWILQRAVEDPATFWVAVEKKWQRAHRIWQKMVRRGLKNLLVVYGEGFALTSQYVPDQCVAEIFVNFPDPWPKRRHGKHRLVKKEFVSELARVLQIGGTATIVTDDPSYAELICKEMGASLAFQPQFPEPYYITEWPEYGTSFFESLWRNKGLQIRYIQFVRIALENSTPQTLESF
jgi:tRNA (guanine-N7-)-methyltransferase